MPPKLLQVCNVGRIVGGTAACAWTIMRALPAFRHHVRFLSPPDSATITALSGCDVSHRPELTSADVAEIRSDAIVLHNTSRSRIVGTWSVPTLQYLHSAIFAPAIADETVCCSHWLARRIGMTEDRVLWQAVPKPAASLSSPRGACDVRDHLVVGRICTPRPRKWPRSLIPFYAELAARVPVVEWEFVGCPPELQSELKTVCRNRARFHPAGWQQRALLTRWDALLYSNPSLPESFGRTVAEAMRRLHPRRGSARRIRGTSPGELRFPVRTSRGLRRCLGAAVRPGHSPSDLAASAPPCGGDVFADPFRPGFAAAAGHRGKTRCTFPTCVTSSCLRRGLVAAKIGSG